MASDPLPPTSISDLPPTRPVEPDAADCCGEGCPRCIFDVHDEAMERYEAAMAAWRKRHPDGQLGQSVQPDSDTDAGSSTPATLR